VLIVEDEEPIAEALASIVEEAGYVAIAAPHGKAALELAVQHRPALIFTDLMMPKMSGSEFIRALRAELNSNTPPIVIMTAGDIRFAMDAGADSVLKKPFELAVVEALLLRFLEAEAH
jgi:DNA-binding response OmpR family regulator